MNKCLAFVVSLAVLAPLAGCKVEARVEPLVVYKGQARNDSVGYAAGQSLLVQSRMGDVTVTRSSATDVVEVTFEPFTMDTEDNEQIATDQIRDMLNTTIEVDGDVVKVQVFRDDGASGNLGADVHVLLPSGFDGAFEATSDMGDVDVDLSDAVPTKTFASSGNGEIILRSARGPLSAITDLGDIEISVAAWSDTNGVVSTDNGDIGLSVPSGANGKITAFADGPDAVVLGPEPLPEDWADAETAPNSKSFTFGDGSGGQVDIETGLGDIVLGVN
jgi:hypothetical protein